MVSVRSSSKRLRPRDISSSSRIDEDSPEPTLSSKCTNNWVLCIVSHDGAVLQNVSIPFSTPRSVKWDGIGNLVAVTFTKGICVVASELCSPGGPALPLGKCSSQRFSGVHAENHLCGRNLPGTFVISDMRESKRETDILFWQVGELEECSAVFRQNPSGSCCNRGRVTRVWGAPIVRTLEGPVLLAGGWGFCAAATVSSLRNKRNETPVASTISVESTRVGRNTVEENMTFSDSEECAAPAGGTAPHPIPIALIHVFDGLGRDVFTFKCPFEPHHLALGEQGLAAASGDTILYFPFTVETKGTDRSTNLKCSYAQLVYTEPVAFDLKVVDEKTDTCNKQRVHKESIHQNAKHRCSHMVSAVAVGKGYILTALKDGELLRLSLPELILEHRSHSEFRFCRMLLNCDANLAAAADAEGSLCVISTEKNGPTTDGVLSTTKLPICLRFSCKY